jgi:hypothetical protein
MLFLALSTAAALLASAAHRLQSTATACRVPAVAAASAAAGGGGGVIGVARLISCCVVGIDGGCGGGSSSTVAAAAAAASASVSGPAGRQGPAGLPRPLLHHHCRHSSSRRRRRQTHWSCSTDFLLHRRASTGHRLCPLASTGQHSALCVVVRFGWAQLHPANQLNGPSRMTWVKLAPVPRSVAQYSL